MAGVRSNLASPSSPITAEARSICSRSAGTYEACPATGLFQRLQGGCEPAAGPGNQGHACLAEKNECNNTDKRKGWSQTLPSVGACYKEGTRWGVVPTRDPRCQR